MDGVLIIDKPARMTSHDVVARTRTIIGERRIGHTGTLDPFATGVLVLLIGRATRLAQFLSNAEKEYEATIRLGQATDTGDITGTPVVAHIDRDRIAGLQPEEIETAIASLRGEIDQVPPMYSAKKIGGKKLYEHARRGEHVDREPIRVTISEIEAIFHDRQFLAISDDGSADLCARVVCSAGTYVRALAEDLGKKLGIGAHLAALRRTRAGRFKADDAISLEELAERVRSNTLKEILISPNDAVSHLPLIDLSNEDAQRTLHGTDYQLDETQAAKLSNQDYVRMFRAGELIAVGRYEANCSVVHPAVVIGNT